MKTAPSHPSAVLVPLACWLAGGTGLMGEPAHLALGPDLVVPAFHTEIAITVPNPTHRIVHVLNVHFVDCESFLADLAHAVKRP
jgi:hypothetical protein